MMAGFRDLANRLGELAKIPSRIAAPVADGINAELANEFASGSNAYGNAWKPLKPQTVRRKGGDARILMRTYRMAAETVARPMPGAGVEITSLEYGVFHQGGTKHMVARKILPDGSALPPSWTAIIAREVESAFKRVLG